MPDNCNFDSIPLTQAQEIRTPNLFNLNYTNQDFWSIKQRLTQYIQEQFSTQFTDLVESDLGIMLIENYAFIGDMLSFKMDQIANEPFIDTVTEIENAFRIAKLVGFQPTPPIASRALFSATLSSLLSTDMVITTPLRIDVVANDVPTSFELFPADSDNNPLLEEDIIIPAGAFSNTSIIGVEGKTIIDPFDGTGSSNQSLTLTTTPVIYDSVRVDVDGVRWEKVDFFTDSQPRREYRVEFNSTYSAFVVFGNNRAGAIPPLGAKIQVTYRSGGGTLGNIVSNFVNSQRPFEVPGFDITVPVTLTNYTKGDFGYNGDGIEDIRANLPAYIRTQNRAVTGTDYKTIADQFVTSFNGQVGRSTVVLRNHGCAGNIIDLFILAKDGTDGLQIATDGLKVALAEELEDKKMITDQVCIKDGVVILVDVIVEITMDRFFAKFKEEIQLKVQRQISDFFSLRNWDYGQDLRDSDINKTLSDIREIKRIDVNLVTNDTENSGSIVVAKYYEILRPDTTTVSFTFE